ncbi:serine protease [Rhizobium ruizarguesonis]
MAIVISSTARPAFLVEDAQITVPKDSDWSDALSSAMGTVQRVIRATARVEKADETSNFIGTAFAISPKLAAITRHVADAMMKPTDDTADPVNYCLNFNADGGQTNKRIAVKVKLTHPYFDFALVELEEEIADDCTLSLSSQQPPENTAIFAVGFPAYDLRNDIDAMRRIFSDTFGRKQLMPGYTMISRSENPDGRPVLRHDASTISGTSGAAIVEIATGEVLGVNFAGAFGQANFAVPAWELARDPFLFLEGVRFTGQISHPPWLELWKKQIELVKLRIDEVGTEIGSELLTNDQIHDVSTILKSAGFVTFDHISSLLYGLPVELQGELPYADNANARLYKCLLELNRRPTLLDFENHSPLYIVLKSAVALRSSDPLMCNDINNYLAMLKKKEARLPRGSAIRVASSRTNVGNAAISIAKGWNFGDVAKAIGTIGEKTVVFEGMTPEELKVKIKPIQITMRTAADGLRALRELATEGSIGGYTVREVAGKLTISKGTK